MREPPPSDSLDADPFTAHLDRGWELLDRGDLDGAQLAADAALAHAPESPELLTLQGAIAAAAGDTDTAIDCFREASDADPEYASPLLQAAEVYLYSLDDPDAAIEHAMRAQEVAAEDDELSDATLLLAEAMLASDRVDDARSAVATLADLVMDDTSLLCRAGQILLDLELLDDADRHLRRALAADPELADAHYAQGLVCEARGDAAGMRAAWLHTRKHDLVAPRPPWHIGQEEFERIAEAAFESLPDEIKEHLANVPILICDYPSIEIVAEGNDPRMLGYFAGVPYGDKSNVGGDFPQPDCVFLYQRNIEAACRDGDELEREIHITLWHETAHFFGLEDDDLDALGLG